MDPYEKDILFLFCGRRSDCIKGLVWEGDGFFLLYKRLELGGFSWPVQKKKRWRSHRNNIRHDAVILFIAGSIEPAERKHEASDRADR